MGESPRWINAEPMDEERVYNYENYTKWTRCRNGVLSEREFLDKVCKISRNGTWKDSLNLEKYIFFARTLRDLDMDDKTIIETLSDLYWAAYRESISGMEPREFCWEEIREMIRLKEAG